MVYMLAFPPLGSQRHKAQYYVGYCEDGRLIVGGHVSGKNAEERAAHLEKLTLPQSEALRKATIAERRARLRLEVAEDSLKTFLAVSSFRAKI